MIFMDRPRYIWFRGRKRLTCHCSGVDLEALHAFMTGIGVPHRAFHNKPNRPHYDLFDEAIDRALDAGAVQVSNPEFVRLLIQHYQPDAG
jgi:hypothetical protein